MSIFSHVPVQKPKMSAFDLSYNNYFTCDMGELIPAFVMPVVPSDRVEYSPTFQVRFAPMVNPVFADIYAKVECFFVPYRLVWSSWKSFITGVPQDGGLAVPSTVPYVNIPSDSTPGQNLINARLVDFLGCLGYSRAVRKQYANNNTWTNTFQNITFSALPFRAYTLIWNEYYRDEFVDSFFTYGLFEESKYHSTALYMGSSSVSLINYGIGKRRWRKDYFTTATPNPQYGSAGASVNVTGNITDTDRVSAWFSVAQFRVANSLQKFLERTNIGGGRYNEFILAHFGCMPTDATIQRPEFLGSVTAPVQVMAINQTSGVADDGASATKRNTLGAQGGQMSAVGTKLCFRRSFKEYGIILGLFSVFPKPVYTDGCKRMLRAGLAGYVSDPSDTSVFTNTAGSRFDFGFPEFSGIGDQLVYRSELMCTALGSSDFGFGYQQRYSEFKMNYDEVHGDFALDDSGLATYTFARFFSFNEKLWPTLNSSFLECTPRADCFVLRDSDASTASVNQCWVQLRNNVRAIRPFPKFSIPTL